MMRNVWLMLSLMFVACKGGENGQLKTAGTTTAIEQKIDSMFCCQIELPQGMTFSRVGQNFIWVSDNEMPTMRNICFYSYEASSFDLADVVRKRDSVMQLNIPGEEPGMYMHTEEKVPVRQKLVNWQGQTLLRTEGLWEMEGDAMGGPFVSHSRKDSLQGRIVVAEAFVFAPGRNKQETMKRLEGVLLKLKMNY